MTNNPSRDFAVCIQFTFPVACGQNQPWLITLLPVGRSWRLVYVIRWKSFFSLLVHMFVNTDAVPYFHVATYAIRSQSLTVIHQHHCGSLLDTPTCGYRTTYSCKIKCPTRTLKMAKVRFFVSLMFLSILCLDVATMSLKYLCSKIAFSSTNLKSKEHAQNRSRICILLKYSCGHICCTVLHNDMYFAFINFVILRIA